MESTLHIPSCQYGFWLPVYKDDASAERSIKRLVLKNFKDFIKNQRVLHDIVFVKDFTWIVKEKYLDCLFCEPLLKTYGWKATIETLEIK